MTVVKHTTTISRRAVQFPKKEFNVEGYIKQVFGKDSATALAVAYAESGRRCNAVGDGGLQFNRDGVKYGASYGVFQIRYLKGRPSPEQLLDCRTNILFAKSMFDRQGFKPWSVFTSKKYLKYLK